MFFWFVIRSAIASFVRIGSSVAFITNIVKSPADNELLTFGCDTIIQIIGNVPYTAASGVNSIESSLASIITLFSIVIV